MNISELSLIFVAGLLASLHCIGMCGPITMMLVNNSRQQMVHLLLYNCGRVFTYIFLGGVAGFMGFSFVNLFFEWKFMPGIISTFFGIIMLVMALKMIFGIDYGRIKILQPVTQLLSDLIHSAVKTKGVSRPLFVGLFNGFLPCPMVYGFLIKATSSANPLDGMLVMMAMGFGTFPAMFILGRLVMYKGKKWLATGITRGGGLILAYLGIVLMYRGINQFFDPLTGACCYF